MSSIVDEDIANYALKLKTVQIIPMRTMTALKISYWKQI